MTDFSRYFDKQNCPVCRSHDKRIVFTNLIHTCNVLKKSGLDLRNEQVASDIFQCTNCGHKYLSMVIKDQFLNHYYSVAESEYYDSVKSNPHDRRFDDTKKFAQLIVEKCPNSSTVLEIGSGMGHLLFELESKGFQTYGVDPSNFATSYARAEFKLNVITGLLDENTFKGKVFDIIILSDVVEHIYDINKLMKLVSLYLAKNGKVVILTGNSNSLYAKLCGKKWLYFFSWEHVSFFNKQSIRYLFDKHSLSLKFFKTVKHTGSYWWNIKLSYLTLQSAIANFLGIRKHRFYYNEAFDHFIAIGQNNKG